MTDATEKTPESFKDRLMADLMRDKKKTAILTVLVLAALIVGLRMVLKSKPSEAEGSSVSAVSDEGSLVPEDQEDQQDLDVPPFGGSTSAADGQGESKSAVELVAITRDLFSLDLLRYKLISKPKTDDENSQSGSEDTQTGPKPATELEIRTAKVKELAKLLYLESTVVSDSPIAIINGAFLREGEKIFVLAPAKEGKDKRKLAFTVTRITADACVVARDGVLVELRLPKSTLSGKLKQPAKTPEETPGD